MFLPISGNMLYSQDLSMFKLDQAWKKKDIITLLSIASEDPTKKELVQDALLQIDFDYSTLSYEELLTCYSYCNDFKELATIFNSYIDESKAHILSEVGKMTPEDLLSYFDEYPQRRPIVVEELRYVISNSLSDLSIQELIFSKENIEFLSGIHFDNEIEKRVSERAVILKENARDYTKKEQEELFLLSYIVKRKSYEYFCAKFQKICSDYASISNVPIDVYEHSQMFNRIISNNIRPTELRDYLQKEADAVCSVINNHRADYSRLAGERKYSLLEITIPELRYDYHIPNDVLSKIPKAYEEYNKDRETISNVGSVASWLFGSLASKIGEGIADVFVGSSLTDGIIAARLQYVDEAFKTIQQAFFRQIDETILAIDKQINENQKSFVKDIRR